MNVPVIAPPLWCLPTPENARRKRKLAHAMSGRWGRSGGWGRVTSCPTFYLPTCPTCPTSPTCQSLVQPRPRRLPIPHRRRRRGVEDQSDVFQRQPGEEAQLGDARLAVIERSELVQRRVEVEDVDFSR